MEKKILIVCGPTATGKTRLGIHLVKKFNGEIISTDSRQVFKYMDIGTGKEWGDVQIWGYDLVDPKKNYSVSEFLKFAEEKLKDIWLRKKLPILVGGTGLYIKAIVDGIDTINIPRSDDLRSGLEEKSIEELYDRLAILDSSKAASLNLSDKKNPRRLARAIEVAIWKIENESKAIKKKKLKNINALFIGLECPKKIYEKRIGQRVEKRIEEGFIDEVEDLLKMGISWRMQSMNTLGYKEAEGFFKSGLTYEEFISIWQKDELKYVKRQLTWFKKDERINWFDVTDPEFYKKVEKMVTKWDNSYYGKKS